jgi:hypothetical protein
VLTGVPGFRRGRTGGGERSALGGLRGKGRHGRGVEDHGGLRGVVGVVVGVFQRRISAAGEGAGVGDLRVATASSFPLRICTGRGYQEMRHRVGEKEEQKGGDGVV